MSFPNRMLFLNVIRTKVSGCVNIFLIQREPMNVEIKKNSHPASLITAYYYKPPSDPRPVNGGDVISRNNITHLPRAQRPSEEPWGLSL